MHILYYLFRDHYDSDDMQDLHLLNILTILNTRTTTGNITHFSVFGTKYKYGAF